MGRVGRGMAGGKPAGGSEGGSGEGTRGGHGLLLGLETTHRCSLHGRREPESELERRPGGRGSPGSTAAV